MSNVNLHAVCEAYAVVPFERVIIAECSCENIVMPANNETVTKVTVSIVRGLTAGDENNYHLSKSSYNLDNKTNRKMMNDPIFVINIVPRSARRRK
jgi:hypothetical protein